MGSRLFPTTLMPRKRAIQVVTQRAAGRRPAVAVRARAGTAAFPRTPAATPALPRAEAAAALLRALAALLPRALPAPFSRSIRIAVALNSAVPDLGSVASIVHRFGATS